MPWNSWIYAMTKRALLFPIFLAAFTANAQVKPIDATIDAGKIGAPISKYVYGQFLEHIAGTINTGIWAEMMEDRKFYYDIVAQTPAAAAAPVPGRRGPQRRWTPIGPGDSVVMDGNHPYAGQHTPLIKLNGTEPRGVGQAGLAVRKGKSYTGRVVLAGDAGARVAVSLVWGTNATDRQTVAISKLGAEYVKFPLRFTSPADSGTARLEIAGTGAGAFHIGAVSLMPADNRSEEHTSEL